MRRLLTWRWGSTVAFAAALLLLGFTCLFQTTLLISGRLGGTEIEIEGVFGSVWVGTADRTINDSTSVYTSWYPNLPAWRREFSRGSAGSLLIFVPVLWLVLPLGLLTGVFWAVHIRSCRRRSAAACPACGYDLSGIAGRCPECGHDRGRGKDATTGP